MKLIIDFLVAFVGDKNEKRDLIDFQQRIISFLALSNFQNL
ncbi:hypothetical protein [uncultured Algibacter sp.]|tara:strand:- start:4 stop:126 length:123 start_codon:yes stop_codon:yes gene_type:complete